MSKQTEAETKLKIRVEPSFLCLAGDAVCLNRQIAYETLVEFNQVAKGSALEQAIDHATKHIATYDAPPIIVTPVPTENVHTLLMNYNLERCGEGNDIQSVVTSSLRDYMRWSALRESFERSGVPIHTHMLANSVGSRGVWPRDYYFKIGRHAFFPDPNAMDDSFWVDDTLRQQIKEAHAEIVQLVTRAGLIAVILQDVDFAGGDIILDPVENYLFWGYRHYPSEEDRQTIKDAIHQHTGQKYKIIPIERDGHRHVHLDIGMSPKLPNDHFLVSYTLGRDSGGRYEGYERLKNYIGSTDRFQLQLRRSKSDRMITVSGYDASDHLITNLISMGPVVFMSSCDNEYGTRLENDGIVVNAPKYAGPFTPGFQCRHIGGGGVRCLTNEL